MKYIATPCTGSIRHARKGMQMERVPFGNHLPRVPNLCGSHRPLCTGHLGQANGAECHSARLTGSPHPALHQHTPRTSFSSLNTWLPAVQTLRMEPPKKKVQEKQEVRAGCTPHLSKLVNSSGEQLSKPRAWFQLHTTKTDSLHHVRPACRPYQNFLTAVAYDMAQRV